MKCKFCAFEAKDGRSGNGERIPAADFLMFHIKRTHPGKLAAMRSKERAKHPRYRASGHGGGAVISHSGGGYDKFDRVLPLDRHQPAPKRLRDAAR